MEVEQTGAYAFVPMLAFVIQLYDKWPGKEALMPTTALVQTRIDPAIRDKAAEVLDGIGMTVSDAVRVLLTRIAKEGALPAGLTVDPVAHDAWFRAKVMDALANPGMPVPHDEVQARFAQRRAEAKGAARDP